MRRSAQPVQLDRRIQIGAAHITLAVRSGEPSWGELRVRLAEFAAERFLLVTDGTAPGDHLARVRALAAAQAPTTLHDLRDGPLPNAPALPGAPASTATAVTTVIAVGGERACAVPADVRVPTDLAAACGPALALRRPAPAAALVWVRADQLAAGPAARTRAGLVAVVRHVLAVCPAHYRTVARLLAAEARHDARTVTALLALCADARAALVCFDPDETGPALALGYGRSLAAAVRSVAGPALAPGDADALGLLLAAEVAARLGLADRATGWAHRELLALNGSATTLPRGVDVERLVAAAVVAARPGLLLLADLGRPYCSGGRLQTPVDRAVLRAAVEGLAGRAAVPHSRAATTARPSVRDAAPEAAPSPETAPALAPALAPEPA
ncbi:hypothetical protein ACFP3U_04255 [Kitasatospora misakiensis]|uniref:3-dehydroquinate synthase C-terminal domain-containing protein n=1 Tax=Kitasatospora misakiensis TaxID=67330 RepID=A0ABW0WXB7_9ACTN